MGTLTKSIKPAFINFEDFIFKVILADAGMEHVALKDFCNFIFLLV